MITRSYKTNLHRASIKHDTQKWQNTIKEVNVVSQKKHLHLDWKKIF